MKWTGPAAVTIDQVRALRDAGVEAEVAFTSPGSLEGRFRAQGWARPLLTRPRGPKDLLQDAMRISRVLDRERFDLLHCHLSHDHLAASLALAGRDLPLVRTFHHERQVRGDPLARRLIRKSSGVAFANGAIGRKFTARYGDRVPTAVLPPVVDTGVFEPGEKNSEIRDRFGLPTAAFLIGTIGKISRGRGQDSALRILARTRHSEIALLQIGKGEWRNELHRLARRLGVQGRNFETGYQEDFLPELYRLMDAFLFTAPGSDQGHRAVLEALASGLPVVSLDLPGITDFELEKGPGFRVPNEGAAADCLDFLFEHASERAAMGAAARSRASAFSSEAFARRAGDFYARVLETGKNRRRRSVSGPEEEGSS